MTNVWPLDLEAKITSAHDVIVFAVGLPTL